MSVRTTSQIFEEVEESLLSDDNLFSVTIVDSQGVSHEMEEAVVVDNPFAFDYSRFCPNEQVMDLDRFIQVASEIIEYAQTKEGISGDALVKLVAEYPGDDFSRYKSGEVITWRLISRGPAMMSAKGTSRPQRAAGFSYNLQNPQYPNKVITVETRPLDHVVEFVVWSKDAGKANRRAMWLERLFIAHSWAFKIQGANRFYFEGRLADNYRTTGGQPIYERPLRFKVRLMEFQVIADPMIRHINFAVGLNVSHEDD